ncbi:putative F-box protein At3g10790 [Chenopodium quinoa]|uniref:putative F-box protein At3g10790 n=1 Tax=Chenopodium quinoa TaxID=63459 RepID=UPI000B786FED|nr:putative F-box protein At3g10790 [Chenopodium quinoa]
MTKSKKPTKTLIKSLPKNSAQNPNSLPVEVEPIILTSLPVKSLLQFRSVSKTWLSVIDNPFFAYSHLSRAETRLGVGGSSSSRILITFSNSDGSRHYLYSVGLFGGRAVHHLTLPRIGIGIGTGTEGPMSKCNFLSPVKGLVCFFNGKNVFVCNPSTRKVRSIPPCPNNYKNTTLNSYFHKPFCSYSFGFDSSSNVFKILNIFGTISKDDNKLYNVESRVLIIKTPDEFSFDSCSWRKISSSFPYSYPFRTQGVFLNGSIYWIGKRAPGEENIVCFDVEHEQFRLIPSPPYGVPSKSKLANVGESLGIISFKDYGDCSLELWVYFNSKWVKKDAGTNIVALKRKGIDANFASIVGNGGMLLTPDVLLLNFVLRSLNDGKVKGIRISGLPGWVNILDYKKVNFSVFNYVESLIPLDFTVRFGDFVADLAGVRGPKQALPPMKLVPHEEDEVMKEWEGGLLVFGGFEGFEIIEDKSGSGKRYMKLWLRKLPGKEGLIKRK